MTTPARIALAATLVVALAGSLLAVTRARAVAEDNGRLSLRVSELQRELAFERKAGADETVARASHGGAGATRSGSFHTWSHLIAALHAAAADSRLDRFEYRTGNVIAADEELGGTGLPERRMTATVSGRGSYPVIVEWVGSLPHAEPPLKLERLEITAEEGAPSFIADVSLATALPIEAPRLLALTDVDAGGED